MTTGILKNCVECGHIFRSSRTGYTVRCPGCRGKKTTKLAPKLDMNEVVCRCGALSRGAMLAGETCVNECHRASWRG